jgi:hypothetical protein
MAEGETEPRRFDITPYLSGLLAALWVVLAFLNPETTYHLAPVLVAGAYPVGLRRRANRRVRLGMAAAAAVGSLLVALVVTLALWLAGRLDGPTLLPFGDAAVESVVFALTGAVIGFGFAVVPLPWDDAEESD